MCRKTHILYKWNSGYTNILWDILYLSNKKLYHYIHNIEFMWFPFLVGFYSKDLIQKSSNDSFIYLLRKNLSLSPQKFPQFFPENSTVCNRHLLLSIYPSHRSSTIISSLISSFIFWICWNSREYQNFIYTVLIFIKFYLKVKNCYSIYIFVLFTFVIEFFCSRH